MNNLKANPNLYEVVFDMSHMIQEKAIEFIRNYINELSTIESKQNCIPKHVARRNIEFGLKLANGEIVDDFHYQSAMAKLKIISATSEIPIYAVIRAIIYAFKILCHQITIIYDEPRKEFIEYLMKNLFEAKLLTEKLDKLENYKQRKSFSSMFVFKLSDLNAATYHLIESLNDPIAPWKIGYIYIQESCYDEFIEKLTEKLQPYAKEILYDQKFLNDYKEIYDNVNNLKCSVIIKKSESLLFPLICHEFDRDYFLKSHHRFSPVIILKSIRTVKEAITLAKNDKANAASIWCFNHSLAYEIINKLDYSLFWINCLGIIENGVPIKIADLSKTDSKKYLEVYKRSGVTMKNSYHLEYFLCNEGKNDEYYKTVIFPFGVTFGN